MEQHARTIRLIGADAFENLRAKRVIVFGVGGVGGFAAEALVRAGVGNCAFVDGDRVDISNINRQILATHDTIGQPKAEVMCRRARSINPEGHFQAYNLFYSEDTAAQIDLGAYDCVVDAIDSVASKILLIERASAAGVAIFSSMGAGNKLDPSRFRVADLAETRVCPLARVMRRELKKRGITHLPVVFSDEAPLQSRDGAHAPGSISFVPSAAGLVLAGAVLRRWIEAGV